MLEPELKNLLTTISKNVEQIHKGNNWWRSLLHGLFTGFGYVMGFIAALVVLGWVLNAIGIIPSFRKEVEDWRKLLQQTQQQRLPTIKGAATPTPTPTPQLTR